MNRIYVQITTLLLIAFVVGIAGCGFYAAKEIPMGKVSASPHTETHGPLAVAVEPYDTAEECQTAFSLDLNRADVLPVLVTIENAGCSESRSYRGDEVFQVNPVRVSATNDTGEQVNPLDVEQVAEKIAATTFGTSFAIGSSVTGLFSGLAGGGIFSLYDLSFGKGFLLGAALGGLSGGLTYGTQVDLPRIKKGLTKQMLQETTLAPHSRMHGFVFLPVGDYKVIAVVVENSTKQPIVFQIQLFQ